ncbi:hypothetical protein AUG19_06225 [archaeon 13_1_20CM_2_54_9]|nr:MAG: hypothetical protein AUJ07_08870 [Crenarchaeota archaeon 13_1_40CM_3_53_5]OLE75159.1 MAG: hypothetical protein AUG19_06225 [archaeon 13_1_20CM_2_54_9]
MFGDRFYKLKRSLNNLAFKMSFVKLTPGSNRPLLPVVSFLVLGFTIFVLGGGLFVAVGAGGAGVQGLLNVQQGLAFVVPGDVNNQTPQEFILASLLYALGVAGLYMLFLSTRNAYRPKWAYSYMMLGVILTIVFIGTAYFVLYNKIPYR